MEYFANSGIRKGVLLAPYADLLRHWMIDEWEYAYYSGPWKPSVDSERGITLPPVRLGRWERQSLPLTVSRPYRELFGEFRRYFEREMRAIGDHTLGRELKVLDRLSGRP